MDWGKVTITSFCVCLGLACGPGNTPVVDTEGDTETDTEGTGSTGDPTATNPTATNPTATNPTSNSDTGTATATTTSATTNATSDSGPADTGTGETTIATTGECPFGTEGCLCDIGAICDDGLVCNDEGICEAPPACEPIDTDPHGDEGSALGLDELGCGDGMDLGVIGTIEGPEVDWYTFFGNDAGFCGESPGATITADVPLEVCVYIECQNGNIDQLNCGGGSADATSPDGRDGCCGTDGALIENYGCSGFGGKDVDAFISIGSDEEICTDYALSYSY